MVRKMTKVAIIYDDIYLEHRPEELDPTHPERKERLICTMDIIKKEKLIERGIVDVVKPRMANEEEILRVHDKKYFESLKDLDKVGGYVDPDTPAPRGFLKCALFSAGGAIVAGELVVKGEYSRAFALIRPPGHHAGPNRGAGFCYVNNIAIMIEHIRSKWNVKKVAIIDWDAHFGDGTYDIYSSDPNILYISIHQDPSTAYPGRGFIHEVGEGEAKGTKVCIPVPPGTSDNEYMMIFNEVIEPIIHWFKPDFIAISAGQDCHFSDPITELGVTARGCGEMMRRSVEIAKRVCNGKVAVVLEGGYSVNAGLPYANLAVILALAELDISHVVEPNEVYEKYGWKRRDNSTKVSRIIKKVKEMISNYIELS